MVAFYGLWDLTAGRDHRPLRSTCSGHLRVDSLALMVGSRYPRVHAARAAFHTRLQLFPNAMSERKSQSWEMSCAQIAIIPRNIASDAKAAASSTKIFNIIASYSRT